MRSTIVAAVVLALASTSAFAQFKGPGAETATTVAEAKEASDDTMVSLTAHVVAQVGDDDYTFRDSSGEMRIEIDDDLWMGREITPETMIRITGEVDRKLWGVLIDVESFEILPAGASPEKGGFKTQ